jgi:hypothetical protein
MLGRSQDQPQSSVSPSEPFAFVPEPEPRHGVEHVQLSSEELAVVSSPSYALAHHSLMPIAALAGGIEHVVLRSSGDTRSAARGTRPTPTPACGPPPASGRSAS